MGGSRCGGVVGLRIESARENNPFESAPGGCGKGQGAVEDGVHIGTVPARLRRAVPADDRIVAGDKEGTSGMVCRAAIAVIQSEMDGECGAACLSKLAARRAGQGNKAFGEDGPIPAVVDGGPRGWRRRQRPGCHRHWK